MTGSEKRAADFVAVVKQVLATVPPPRLSPGTDVEAAAAELVERIMAEYPPPHAGMTHMVVTPEGEAFGFVEGSTEDMRGAATLLDAVTGDRTGWQLLTGRRVLDKLGGSGKDWYRIANKAAPRAEVWIYDDIGYFGLTAADFSHELADITAPEILVHLASRGGDVVDGIAVYNSLRMHEARITIQVDSLAASAASVIAQAGDERIMVTGSQMMIHDAWGLAAGNADDLRDHADLLDKQTDNIAGIYAERAGDGRKKSHFQALMRDETWMTPAEAVAEGLADSIRKPATGTNRAADVEALDLTAFIASTQITAA